MAENKLTSTLSKLLEYLLLSAAFAYIAVYIAVACFRLYYPFDLEWLEGGAVAHVARILSGQLLYVSPSLEFIPYNYTPLFFYISAAASGFLEAGFMPLRMVSFVSSLGCFYLIFLIVAGETKSRYSGILAAGLFAATFHLSGSWFDMGRPDSFFLFLLLSSLYVIRFKSSNSSAVVSGVIISLAFLTKQTALPILLPVILYTLLSDWRRSIYFIITSAVIIAGSTFILDYMHDGWYTYYVFELPSNFSSRVEPAKWLTFWTEDIIPPFKIALGMSLIYFMMFIVKPDRSTFLFYFLTSAGMFGASLAPRLQAGGVENVLIPAHAMIAILFGLSFHRLSQFFSDMYSDRKHILISFISVLCLVQFGSGYLTYDPSEQLPSESDYEAGEKLMNTLSHIEGRIFLPSRSFIPGYEHETSSAHRQNITDNILYGREDVKVKLKDELQNAFKEKRFSAIITSSDKELWMGEELMTSFEQNYILKENLIYSTDNAFIPVAGFRTRPAGIYVPINSGMLN